MNNFNIGRLLKISIILYFGITIGLWQYWAVPIHDDFCYIRMVPSGLAEEFWNGYGEPIKTLNDVVISAKNHYLYINGRLANIIMIFMILMPRWLTSTILGLFACGLLMMLTKCATLLCNRVLSLWVIWLGIILIWVLMPWSDHMMSQDYLINYLVSSFFAFAYCYIYLSDSRHSRFGWAICCIVAFIAGMMHEGFAIPCIIASLAVLIRKNRRSGSRYLLLSVLCFGAFLSIFSPSTITRLLTHQETSGITISFNAVQTFFNEIRGLLVIGVIILVMGKIFKMKFWDISSLGLHYWVWIMITAAGIAIILGGYGRYYWFFILAAIVIILVCMNLFPIPVRIKNIACCILTFMGLLFSTSLIYNTIAVCNQQRKLLSDLINSSDGSTYITITPQYDIPWYTFGMIQSYYPFVSELGLFTNNYHFDRMPLILPEIYDGKPYSQWEKLPGKNSFRGGNGFWYSTKKYENGEKIKATLRRNSAFFPFNKEVVIESLMSDRAYSITEEGDSVWTYNFNVPLRMKLVRMDIEE